MAKHLHELALAKRAALTADPLASQYMPRRARRASHCRRASGPVHHPTAAIDLIPCAYLGHVDSEGSAATNGSTVWERSAAAWHGPALFMASRRQYLVNAFFGENAQRGGMPFKVIGHAAA